MSFTGALLDWGAPVSSGYLTSVNVMAVQIPYFLVAMAILTGLLALWNKPTHLAAKYVLRLLLAGLLARAVLVELIRLVFLTDRPFVFQGFVPLIDPVHEPSFPSSHVAVLSALAFTAWGVRPAAGAALLAGAVLVGIARVFAGVHWPVDILGGVLVGALAAILAQWLPRLIFRPRKHA